MSNKCYAVVLVLAGMIGGILFVSLASSPATAKLPNEGRETTRAVPTVPPRVSVPPVAFPGAMPPVVARSNIRVYPVGMGGKNDEEAYAYVIKDGQLWLCEDTLARKVNFR